MDNKTIAIIGLGKMGLNIGLNLKDKGIRVLGYSRTKESRDSAMKQGVIVKDDIKSLMNL